MQICLNTIAGDEVVHFLDKKDMKVEETRQASGEISNPH